MLECIGKDYINFVMLMILVAKVKINVIISKTCS